MTRSKNVQTSIERPGWVKAIWESQKQSETTKILEFNRNYGTKLEILQRKHKLAKRCDSIIYESDLGKCPTEIQQLLQSSMNHTMQNHNTGLYKNESINVIENKLYGGTAQISKSAAGFQAGDWICEYPGKFVNIQKLSKTSVDKFKNLFWMFKIGSGSRQYISFKTDSSIAQALAGSCYSCSNVEFQVKKRDGIDRIWLRAIHDLGSGGKLWVNYGKEYWCKVSDCENPKCPVCGCSLMLND